MASKRPGSAPLFVMWDVTFPENDKVLEIGAIAELIYFRSVLLCKRNNSDGHFTTAQIRRDVMDRLDAEQVASALAELNEAGLVESHDRNHYVPGYLERNMSSGEIEAEKSQRSIDGKWGNHVKYHINEGSPKPSCDFCYPPGCDDDHDPLEAPLVPPSGGRSGGDRGGDRMRSGGRSGATAQGIGGDRVGDRGRSLEKEQEVEREVDLERDQNESLRTLSNFDSADAEVGLSTVTHDRENAEKLAKHLLTYMGGLSDDVTVPSALPGYLLTCLRNRVTLDDIYLATGDLKGSRDVARVMTKRVGDLARRNGGSNVTPIGA